MRKGRLNLNRSIFAVLLPVFLWASVDGSGFADPPTLGIGDPAPDFNLPGVDGRNHTLSDFSDAKVLVVVFTCNWSAYSGLESAGSEPRCYSPVIRPIKVICLGRLSPGLILKTFEKGADGVLLLGCPPGDRHPV